MSSELEAENAGPARQLLAHEPLLAAWQRDGGDAAAALRWTRRQVGALRALLRSDDGWERVLAAFERGRAFDSWLATDWPSGLDELLLCAPLCRLVEFECARCTIGARQSSYSCAHPGTVFGRIGALLATRDRDALLRHLDAVDAMLDEGVGLQWSVEAGAPRT